jgi:RNA polymerase sigma factor (sigma-70 family)
MAAGHEQSGIAFVRRFQSNVYGLAFHLVRDSALAEDIAQEAMTRAWKHGASYDARRGAVKTWLLTITRNLAIDALRMRRADPTDPEQLEAALLTAPEGDPGEVAVVSADLGLLRRELARLPAQQRRAVVLANYYGQTCREIADAEDIPVGTVKTRIRAGLMKLRASVQEESP